MIRFNCLDNNNNCFFLPSLFVPTNPICFIKIQKAIWLIHLIITTISLNLHVIGATTGHSNEASSKSPKPISKSLSPEAKISSDKSSPSSSSSWLDTGLYQNPLKPKLFQLPYEKITNPLTSFISWITQNERNERTYDQLYLSGKSTGQRSPVVMGSPVKSNKEKEITKTTTSSSSLSSPSSSSIMSSSSNLNPLAVKASSSLVDSSSSSSSSLSSSSASRSSLSSLSSLSSVMFPSFKSWPVNHRRQDLLSSFSFGRSSLLPSASISSSIRSNNMFKSKDLSPSPQFSVTFPRSTPPNKRQLSPETLGIISKYNPNPKVFFIPKYYTSPYSVSVPFITHADKLLLASNHRGSRINGGGGGSRGDDVDIDQDNYGEESVDRDYDRDEHRNESIDNNSMTPNEDKYHHNSNRNGDKNDRYRRNHQRRRNRNKNRKSSNKHGNSFKPNGFMKSGYSVNQITSNGENGLTLKSPMLLPRVKTNINNNQQSKRYRSRNKPSSYSSSYSSSSSPWRAMNTHDDDGDKIHRPVPYTGKAQYSTIDNSSDPMSPSASRWIPFWTKRKQ